jgi:hypothetical protein
VRERQRSLWDGQIAVELPKRLTRRGESGGIELGNGELIQKAEAAGYDVPLSTDKNVRYEQNLAGRQTALVTPLLAIIFGLRSLAAI